MCQFVDEHGLNDFQQHYQSPVQPECTPELGNPSVRHAIALTTQMIQDSKDSIPSDALTNTGRVNIGFVG